MARRERIESSVVAERVAFQGEPSNKRLLDAVSCGRPVGRHRRRSAPFRADGAGADADAVIGIGVGGEGVAAAAADCAHRAPADAERHGDRVRRAARRRARLPEGVRAPLAAARAHADDEPEPELVRRRARAVPRRTPALPGAHPEYVLQYSVSGCLTALNLMRTGCCSQSSRRYIPCIEHGAPEDSECVHVQKKLADKLLCMSTERLFN